MARLDFNTKTIMRDHIMVVTIKHPPVMRLRYALAIRLIKLSAKLLGVGGIEFRTDEIDEILPAD